MSVSPCSAANKQSSMPALSTICKATASVTLLALSKISEAATSIVQPTWVTKPFTVQCETANLKVPSAFSNETHQSYKRNGWIWDFPTIMPKSPSHPVDKAIMAHIERTETTDKWKKEYDFSQLKLLKHKKNQLIFQEMDACEEQAALEKSPIEKYMWLQRGIEEFNILDQYGNVIAMIYDPDEDLHTVIPTYVKAVDFLNQMGELVLKMGPSIPIEFSARVFTFDERQLMSSDYHVGFPNEFFAALLFRKAGILASAIGYKLSQSKNYSSDWESWHVKSIDWIARSSKTLSDVDLSGSMYTPTHRAQLQLEIAHSLTLCTLKQYNFNKLSGKPEDYKLDKLYKIVYDERVKSCQLWEDIAMDPKVERDDKVEALLRASSYLLGTISYAPTFKDQWLLSKRAKELVQEAWKLNSKLCQNMPHLFGKVGAHNLLDESEKLERKFHKNHIDFAMFQKRQAMLLRRAPAYSSWIPSFLS